MFSLEEPMDKTGLVTSLAQRKTGNNSEDCINRVRSPVLDRDQSWTNSLSLGYIYFINIDNRLLISAVTYLKYYLSKI